MPFFMDESDQDLMIFTYLPNNGIFYFYLKKIFYKTTLKCVYT